jgi:hypothetical protein
MLIKLQEGMWVDPSTITEVFAAEGDISEITDEMIQPRVLVRTKDGHSHLLECQTDEEARFVTDKLSEAINTMLSMQQSFTKSDAK